VTAEPREWTITFPAGMELLSANDRDGHWARRKRVTRSLRETAGWLARQQQVPRPGRAHVLGTYEPPDHRRRDPANLYPSFKACPRCAGEPPEGFRCGLCGRAG
jgi:hypothetical protein